MRRKKSATEGSEITGQLQGVIRHAAGANRVVDARQQAQVLEQGDQLRGYRVNPHSRQREPQRRHRRGPHREAQPAAPRLWTMGNCNIKQLLINIAAGTSRHVGETEGLQQGVYGQHGQWLMW